MTAQSIRTGFRDFWSEVHRPYWRVCWRVAWQLPVAILIGGFVVRLAQCCLGIDSTAEVACRDLSDPWGMMHRWWSIVPYVYLLMPIPLAAGLYGEWVQYRADRPSYFTHGGWKVEGPPGYTRRLSLLESGQFKIGAQMVHLEVTGTDRQRYHGDFTERALLRAIRRQFVRRENRPVLDTEDHVQWRIAQTSGTEVHIDLRRTSKEPIVWTLETAFYEWVGRNQKPRLVREFVSEFVALQPEQGE